VSDFEAALACAAAARQTDDPGAERVALSRALDVYAGDLLPDCYDDWIAPFRERLSQASLRAAKRLADLQEHAGDIHGALHYAMRLLQADPLDEGVYRRLMRLHAQNGDRINVVRTFTTCQSALRSELATTPDGETRAAYQAALQQAAANAARPGADHAPLAARRTILSAPPSLVGRGPELAHVRQLLASHRLVTLTGSGGVGKSSLARQALADLQASFADGVWWVDLGPVADAALVGPTVAAALRVPEGKAASTTEALAGWLRDRRLLLMLDNCEHLAPRVARLAQALLPAAPHLRILTTSQRSLGVAGEIARRVPPLAVPPPSLTAGQGAHQLTALGQNESVQLFVERARRVAHLHPHRRQRQRGRPNLPPAGRHPARYRAGGHAHPHADPQQIAERLDDALALLVASETTTEAGRKPWRRPWRGAIACSLPANKSCSAGWRFSRARSPWRPPKLSAQATACPRPRCSTPSPAWKTNRCLKLRRPAGRGVSGCTRSSGSRPRPGSARPARPSGCRAGRPITPRGWSARGKTI
jgi:hypothetical protein